MRETINRIVAVAALVAGTAMQSMMHDPECGTKMVRPEAAPEPTTSARMHCDAAASQTITLWRWRAYDAQDGRWQELAHPMTEAQARRWVESKGLHLERIEGSAEVLAVSG